MMRHNNLLWKWAICRHLFPLLIFAVGMTKMNAQTLNKVSRDALMQSVQQEIPDRNSSTNTMQIVNSLPRTSRTNGQLDYTAYDWQSNAGAITRTIVWPDGKVNFGFTHASNASYSDRGTAIGTYDAVSDQWISSGGRVESEKTGFGSIARYGENGIVIAAHNSTTVGIFIIGNKDDVTSLQGSVSAVSHLNDSKEPTWANVMTSGPNRDIIHVVATGWSDNKIYYFRSQDGGQTWDKQNVVLPFMGSDYGPYWGSNCCYWMETTEDNCLSLVVNNPWSDGMVIYSYDNGETWQRKVFYQHPNPFGTFDEMFLYPRWTSCQWDSQHHLHVLYEFTGCSGSPNSSNSYPSVGGVAYWNETMPYNPNGITQSAIPGNLTPGQPFVMDKDYLYNDIYSSWWNYPNATHVMWPEYIGYLPALDDNGNWEDPYQATQFNITDWALHGFYHSSVCGFPVLCKVPGTDGMVAVWCAMDENHTDINGNFYFKIFASYSGNGGVNWTNMVHLTNTPAYHDKELVYLQATIVGNKLIIAAQCDGETGTYVQNNDSDPNDTYYQGFTFDLNELFDISGDLVSISATPNPSAGGHIFGTGSYTPGSTCTLTATAFEGYTFVNWTENGEVVSTANPYTFTVTGNRSLVANFTVSGGDEHEYVDLGLPSGLLWATCNVGASSPEEYGDCFAWGETQPKDTYNWNNYQYCNGSNNTLTKYCNDANYGYNGFTDTLTILQPSDDAATANWGAYWHTPTKEEWQELYQNTTHVWTTQNGVNGQLFTASNGNSLFLPATAGRYGYYWLSSVNTDSPSNAWELYFSSGNYCGTDYYDRYYGQSVRAVRSPMQNTYFIIDVTANPAEGGEITGGGDYQEGVDCTLTATANAGYTFVNWTENGEVVSTENPYIFTVTNNRVLEAVFTTNIQTTFTRVTSVSGLEVGANYLIVGHNDELGVFAMGYQKPNNRNAVVVDEVGDAISVTIGTDPNSQTDVFQFTLGGFTDAWTFFDEVKGGYLYAGSSTSNQLKTQTTLDANGQWSITFNADGTAEVVAQGENGHNNMRFNPNIMNITPLFSCYAETSTIDTRVSFYKAGNAVQSYYITTTANPEEGGTINGSGSYAIGSTCTLTATANAGYTFVNWTENGEVVSTANPYTFTVTGNRSLVANFSGGVSVLLFEDFNENLGVFTTYDVIGAQSWHQGSYQGVTYASMNGFANGTCNQNEDWLISPALNKTGFSDVFVEFRTAMKFDGAPLRVKISTNYNGQGNPNNYDWQDITDVFNFSTGNYEWVESGLIGVNILANVFYLAFVYTSNTQAATAWNIDYVRIEASGYGVASYDITVTANPPTGGTVTGGGNYYEGQTCTLTATANEGYTFINWTENGEVVSTANPYTFTVTGNRNLVANFTVSGGDEHEYVDLGLPSGLLWATCNVGASSPEEYGDCFAWGETQPKDTYNWNNYQYCNGSNNTLTKYCNDANYGYNGFTDTLTILQPIDDAATANWGAYWHTPTKEEWQELYQNTTHIWTTQGGVNGQLFTASNGNSLFLPATAGRYGYYWLSSVNTDSPSNAWELYFSSGNYCGMDYYDRYYGQSVRAVRSPMFIIDVTANPTEGGEITGGGDYQGGVDCTLTATANEGYTFVNWTENGEVVSTEASYTFTVTGNRNLIANFAVSGGDGHQYVDLGLPSGTLWATCNVGANTPEEYGDYFAWGETQPKDYYSWTNYLYSYSGNSQIKYCSLPSYGYNGYTDTLTILLPVDDAATTNWGQDWRMPTHEEWEELLMNTTNSWMVQNGVNGWRFSASNGSSIFLPASGYRWLDDIYGTDQGYYPSCSLNTDYPSEDRIIQFNSGSASILSDMRAFGCPVRAVRSDLALVSVSVTTNTSEGGVIKGAGYYVEGSTCTLISTPSAGYIFANWTENDEVVSTENAYTFTVTGDRNLIANFVEVNFIDIYDGEVTNSYVPVYGSFTEAYQKSEMVYPATELNTMTEGLIRGMRFFSSNTYCSWGKAYFLVFLKEVDETSISNFTGTEGATIVYEGPLRINGGVMDIIFDEPYIYNGGNLLLGVYQIAWNTVYSSCNWFGENREGASVQGYSLNSLDAITPTQRNFIPKTLFTYESGAGMTYFITAAPNPAEGGTVTGDGNYIEGQTCTLTATPNEGYQFLYWTEDEDVVSMEATYSFTVTDNRTLVANFVAYNPSGDLQVFAEYYPDSSNVFSPYVKVYWTGITASRYNIYRAFCYSDDYELIAENVTDTLYIDYAWFNLPLNNYKYGVSVEDGRGGTGQIHWNDAPVATNEILIDASTFGNPTANDGSLGMPLRVNYDNGWLHYDNGNYIKSIGSGLGMLHWGVKFPSETLASYAGNQLKKVAVYMRSGNNEILNISVHVGGTTAPGMSVCSMDFDVSGYNNGFVEFALPEPIFITGTENIWITLSQAGNYPAQASPDSGEPNGRWISLNGQTWMDMANYGLDGSWMIRGYVGDDPAIYWSNCIDKTHYSITATANPTEGGTVTGGGAYSQGTTCTLTATANSGYHFANWTENGVVVSTNANYSFTVTRSRNLVAHFTTNSQVCAINVSTNPSYGGSANGGGYYYYGTICTVNALANSGYIFTNWTENGTVVSIDASYTFTVTGSRNLVANFTAIPQFCTINVYANPSYGGSVTGTGTYAYGINCTLTATATTGYIFLNWTENGTVVSTSANYTFTVTRNRNLVANFTADLPYYGINAVPNPNEGGTITGTGIYMEGQNCTLKAFANSGYTFINWTKNGVVVSTNATYRFVVTEAANYVANFELRSYAITVTASPTEGGTVAGAGTYYYGATCTVTATANSGYFFANWTLNGRVVSYSAEYIFTVTGNRNLVANFVTNPQVCTISTFTNPSYGGTAIGAGYYYTGASCTLTATANSGYAFVNWTENNVVVSTEAEYTFTVTGDRNLAANFTPVGTISAIANPNYGGSITGGGTYQYGTRCTLRATANSGYLFVNWTENGVTVSTNAKYSFTVMGNRNLVANFTVNNNPQVYMISVFANPSYGGSITGSNTYAYGTSCTVTATANSGYTFLNWTENGTVVSTNADYTFTVTGNRTLLANFMADTQLYTINTFANPSYGGTVSGDGGFYYGSSCTVTATANNGYTFVNWTENGTVVSFNANYTFTVKRNRNLVANFSANMEYFGINATPNPIEGGTITGAGIYIEGQTCTLTASPSFGYVFVNWTENGTVVSFDASYTFTVTGSRSLVANFADDMSFVGINANPNPIEGGAIMGAGLYLPGQTCILMAVANSGYIFVNWTENGTVVSDNAECTFIVTGSRNLVANFDIQPSVTQTIQLSQGWNWCSFNVEITLDDLKAALVAALPGTAINIKSQTQNVMYQNGRWTGSLTALNLTRMYMISVGNNCEISLEGQPINPSTLTVTINSGVNWIAFPYSESMTVTDFFGSFPANNDQVKSQSQNARYQGNRWAGQLSTLVPGKGYMYISNTQGTRTFTFPANAK